jgi:mono/diheme cytochrome c family protein
MKASSLIFLGAIVLVVAVFIVFYQIKAQNETTVSDFRTHNLAVFQDNCARCHGASGQGFASYPPLQDNGLTPEQIKHIIRFGQGNMPPFPNIPEPGLTQLAEFVSQL